MNDRVQLRILKTLGFIAAVFFSSCGEDEPLISSDTRELTTLDQREVSLNPTSSERFESASSAPQAPGSGESQAEVESSLNYDTPSGWTEKAPTMFRVVNMAIDAGGEAYVSLVGGSLLDNINRWYKQLGAENISASDLASLEKVKLAGQDAYLVKLSGNYSPGMGRPEMKDVTLLAAISEMDGGVITAKLIAPKSVAEEHFGAFKSFCASLEKK